MNTELETPASDFLNENWEQPNNEEGVYDPNTLTEENLLNINNNNNVDKEEEEDNTSENTGSNDNGSFYTNLYDWFDETGFWSYW